MKRLLLLLPVLLIVLTSGCTMPGGIELPFGGGPTYESDVVIIKDLTAVPSTIRAGQSTRLIAYIQNIGSKKVAPIGTMGFNVTLYDYCSGLFTPNSINCPGGDGKKMGNTGCKIDALLPQEISEIDWTLTAAKDTKLVTPCELKVAVHYPYTTDGLTTITFIEPGEYKRQLEAGTFSTKSHYTAKGDGPIKVFFTVNDQEPIPANEGFTSVSLEFQNMGYGFLADPTAGVKDTPGPRILKENILLGIPENMRDKVKDCEYATTGADGKVTIGVTENVKLIQEKRSLPCSLNIITAGITNEATYQLNANATYLYEFRDSAKVTVNPAV